MPRTAQKIKKKRATVKVAKTPVVPQATPIEVIVMLFLSLFAGGYLLSAYVFIK